MYIKNLILFLISIGLKISEKLKELGEKSCINQYKHTKGSLDYKKLYNYSRKKFFIKN